MQATTGIFLLWATILTFQRICHVLDLDLIPAIFFGSRYHLNSIGKVREKAQSKLGLDVRAKVATARKKKLSKP